MKRRYYLGPALLVVLSALAAVVLVTTAPGLRLAARFALPLVPGQIRVESLDGRLIGPLRLEGLSWQSGAGTLRGERIELDWHPLRLFSGHLSIASLSASGLHWHSSPGTDKADAGPSAFTLPDLPLAVTLSEAEIDGLTVVQDETTLVIDSVRLSGQIDDDGYRVETIRVRSSLFDLDGGAAIATAAPNRLEVGLDWIVRPGDPTPPIEGRLEASGDTARAKLDLNTSGALEIVFAGAISDLLASPALDGRLELVRFDPGEFTDATTGPIAGALDLRLAADAVALDGQLTAARILPGAVEVRVEAGLAATEIAIETLTVRLAGRPSSIDATGTLARDLSRIDLALNWSELAWPIEGESDFSSSAGSGTVSGSLDEYALVLGGDLTLPGVPRAELSLRGSGDRDHLDVAAVNARFEQGELTGSGRLDWATTPAFRFDVASRNIDPRQWHDALTGRLRFDAKVSGSLPESGPQLSVRLDSLAGSINEQALQGSGSFALAANTLRFSNVDLRAGAAVLQANGSLADTLDLRWNLNVPDIGNFVPGVSGEIRSAGTARGKRNRPGLGGDLSIVGLAAGGVAAGRLDGRFEIGVDKDSRVDIELNASGLSAGAFQIDSAKASASGTVGLHQIDFAMEGPGAKLETTLRGGLDTQVWRGEISSLSADRAAIGAWQLVEAAAMSVGMGRFDLSPACLARLESRICAQGSVSQSDPWRIDFDLARLPVATFEPYFPPGLVYEGTVSGAGNVASAASGWAGEAEMLLDGGRVIRREDDGDDVLIAAQTGSLKASFDPGGIQSRLKLDLRDAGLVDADIRLPTDRNGPIGGSIEARLENLGLVTALVPQIGRIRGRIDTRLALGGTLALPEVSGDIGVSASEIVLPDLGITLLDTTMNMNTAGNALKFDATTNSNDGKLDVAGNLRWLQGEPDGEIRISGDAFRAIDLPEIWLDASPNITVVVKGHDVEISGDIAVPAARITPVDISTGVGVSSDQVIIGQSEDETTADRWRIGGRMLVSAGEGVSIKGYGLEGNLSGSVLIVEAPGQPTTGRGALEIVDGKYRAYGQQLDIETGRLEFTGGQIDDPGLNLLASRTSGDVVAGVQVRGALRRPVLMLYSLPSMSDTQTMSYLITGRGIEELSQADQTAVSDAATRLALRGGSVLASSLGRGLGLDSVEFQDEGAAASTSLVIGKHISPRLFVSYGIGLFETINTVRLRYQINSRFTVETQSGAATSADLLYSLER